MSSEAPAGNNSRLRKVLVSIVFVLTNIIAWRASNEGQDSVFPTIAIELPFQLMADHDMKSGVGYVTKDGMWEESDKRYEHDIKILGFTDYKYMSIAKHWYNRLSALVGAFIIFLPFFRLSDVIIIISHSESTQHRPYL